MNDIFYRNGKPCSQISLTISSQSSTIIQDTYLCKQEINNNQQGTNKLYISWIVNSPSQPRLFVLTTRLTKISKNLADWIRSDLFLFVFSSLSASFTGPLSASKSFENPRGRIRLLLFICCYSSPFEGLLRDALGVCLFFRPKIIYFHSFGWIFQNLRTSRYILSVFPVRHFHFHSSRQISQRTFLRAGGTSTVNC